MQVNLLPFAKRMRHRPTEAEAHLWRCLRAHRFDDYKFRRQQPLDGCIVDFACMAKRLVVEVDGSQHSESADDVARTRRLEALGFSVIRFWNNDVLARTDAVLDEIWRVLQVR